MQDYRFYTFCLIVEATKQISINRINYSGDLTPVINRLCDAYSIGQLIRFSIIEIGYEDCNIVIETALGKYVAKIFSKERSKEDVIRYSTIMEKAIEAGVNHPRLFKTVNNGLIYVDDQAKDISMVLMDFVDGQTFLALNRAPNKEELKAIIEQAAKVNQIDHQPSYLFDSWAIPNIKLMFEKVRKFIQPDDIKLVELAIKRYLGIPVEQLPHCFVHGDFTKANVLKGNDGKIYILDFSVANWYPRIQELAVISANLLHDEDSKLSLHERTELIINEYNRINPLTADEKQYLYDYALAGIAMEFIGSNQEKFVKGNNSEETEYWLNLGRNGLRSELNSSAKEI